MTETNSPPPGPSQGPSADNGTQQAAPAGWLPNPDGTATLRYWSGTQWTEHVQSPPEPTPPSPANSSAPMNIKSILLSVGAIAVLTGGLSLSSQEFARYLLPVFMVLFAAGSYFLYGKKLRASSDIFFSVATGLAIYEVWLLVKPKDYKSFGGVVEKWFESDGPTLLTFVSIATGVALLMVAFQVFFKKEAVALKSPMVWLVVSITVLVLTALNYIATHPLKYFELYTIPLGIAFLAVGEYFLKGNEKLSSLAALWLGLFVAFTPSFFAATWKPLSYHAAVFCALFVVGILYGVAMKRSAVFYITPWFFILYCIAAAFYIGDDVAPWVWLMVGGSIVIGCGVFWEKLMEEAKDATSLLKKLR